MRVPVSPRARPRKALRVLRGHAMLIYVFPYTVAVLEVAAGIVFACKGNWRFAIVWLGVGIANFAFAGAKPQ